MAFDVNSPVLFVLVAVVIAFVLAQSVFFLVRAVKRAKAMGMDSGIIKRTIKKAAVFSVAPAISIFIGVITLSFSLGIPLPWLRLSVIGSLHMKRLPRTPRLKPWVRLWDRPFRPNSSSPCPP